MALVTTECMEFEDARGIPCIMRLLPVAPPCFLPLATKPFMVVVSGGGGHICSLRLPRGALLMISQATHLCSHHHAPGGFLMISQATHLCDHFTPSPQVPATLAQRFWPRSMGLMGVD